ncbi:MAG TPA: hypothetical protein VFT14_04645 [Solirubrobacterales bacterium]|nr:hypothetical protein [Solirubrobacterales bacterium]
MENGEGDDRMPPNSTKNLNARLSSSAPSPQRLGGRRINLTPPPIQSSAPPVRIMGTPVRYRGGYHLSV